jgi:hypothetical protein
MKIMVFWDVTPCILVDSYQLFRENCCTPFSFTLKMQAAVSAEQVVPISKITRRHILDDQNLNIHRRETSYLLCGISLNCLLISHIYSAAFL